MTRVHIKSAEVVVSAKNFEAWIDEDWTEEDIYQQLSDWLMKHGDVQDWDVSFESEELQEHIDNLKPYIDPNQLDLFGGEIS